MVLLGDTLTVTGNELRIYQNYSQLHDYFQKIKKIITTNKIEKIIYYLDSSELNILNKLNFPESNIKSIIINSRENSYVRVNNNNLNNQLINLNNLPLGLEELEIINNIFSLRIDIVLFQNLPQNIKKLKLDCCYNKLELNNLPNTLEFLEISCSQQQGMFDYLPSSLKYLYVITDSSFAKVNSKTVSMFDSLPSTIEQLKIIGNYDNELNCLPSNIKVLHLPNYYNFEIKNIPKGLEELKISLDYNFLQNFNVCHNLKKIIIGSTNNKSHLNSVSNFDLSTIPNTIEDIVFGDDFNQKLENLPIKTKKIIFGFNFRNGFTYLDFDLNDTIEHLEFGYCFNELIYKYPNNLKYLKFGRNYNMKIDNLPEGLVELFINERFCTKILKLPTTLEILEFDYYSSYSFDISCIPNSIHTIKLGRNMNICKINIPKNLKNISYSKNNYTINQQLKNMNYVGIVNFFTN